MPRPWFVQRVGEAVRTLLAVRRRYEAGFNSWAGCALLGGDEAREFLDLGFGRVFLKKDPRAIGRPNRLAKRRIPLDISAWHHDHPAVWR
jgi:hypothetical protein